MAYKPLPNAPRGNANTKPDYSKYSYFINIATLKKFMTDRGLSESDAATMAAIAFAESGGMSGNRNKSSGATGLWQINRPDDSLFDPSKNADNAVSIFHSQGFHAWTAYTNGSYKKFLGDANSKSLGATIVDNVPGVGVVKDTAKAVADIPSAIGNAVSGFVSWETSIVFTGAVALGGAALFGGGLYLLFKNTSAGKAARKGAGAAKTGIVSKVAKGAEIAAVL